MIHSRASHFLFVLTKFAQMNDLRSQCCEKSGHKSCGVVSCCTNTSVACRTMNCERDIRFELLARLCPNSTGADIRSVCTEAGMYAIRARRKTVTEQDFLDAVQKVIKGYQKFSATPSYMVYN